MPRGCRLYASCAFIVTTRSRVSFDPRLVAVGSEPYASSVIPPLHTCRVHVQLVCKHWRQVELDNPLQKPALMIKQPVHISFVPFFLRTAASLEKIAVERRNEPLGHLAQIIALASASSPKLHTFTMRRTLPSLLPSICRKADHWFLGVP